MITNEGPVVVGIDGPAETVAAAIHLGAWEAQRRHTVLRLVGACDPAFGGPRYPGLDPAAFARRFATELAARVQDDHPQLTVTAVIGEENPAHSLIDAGRDAVLVIVAGDLRLRYGNITGGQVASQVAAHATVPVVVVPTPADPRTHDRRVVVGVDGSTGGEDALAFAFDEAAARGAVLHAVSVWDYPTRHGFRPLAAPADPSPLRTAAQAALAEALAPWTEKYPDVTVVRDAVRDADPGRVLCTAAVEADLLVVGPRGRGGFASRVLGSVSAGLVHYSPAPVAIVHGLGGAS